MFHPKVFLGLILLFPGVVYAFPNNISSEACRSEFIRVVKPQETKTDYLTGNRYVKVKGDYQNVLAPLVLDSIVKAHGHLRENFDGFVYTNPGYFALHSEVKFNRYVEKGNEDVIKGYYISVNTKTSSYSSSYKFVYSYFRQDHQAPTTRLLRVEHKINSGSPKKSLVCEGFVNTDTGKYQGETSKQKMKQVARDADNGEGYFDSEELPDGFGVTAMNISENELEGQPKVLFEILNKAAGEDYFNFTGRRFGDDKYLSIERSWQVVENGVVVGYIVRCFDDGYSSIIEDGAWTTFYIYIDGDGELKVAVARSGTA